MLVDGKPYNSVVTKSLDKISSRYLLAKAEAEEVCLPLGLYKDQRPLLGITPILIENANKLVLLLIL